MIIVYLSLVLIGIALVAYIVLKSVQLGLRWQIELKKEVPPTMPNVVSEQLNKLQEKKQIEEQTNILNEWLGGAKKAGE